LKREWVEILHYPKDFRRVIKQYWMLLTNKARLTRNIRKQKFRKSHP